MTTILHLSAALYTEDGYVLNVGDEGLSAALAARVKERTGARVIRGVQRLGGDRPALGPTRTDARPLRLLAAKVRAADAVLIGGGTLLQADPGLLRWQMLVAMAARVTGRPLFISHVGAENLSGGYAAAARMIVRSARYVSVRDERSRAEVQRASGRSPAVVADAMFLHRPHADLPRDRTAVAVNLKPGYGPGLTANLADAIVAATTPSDAILLAPFDRRDAWDAETLSEFERAVGSRRACRWIADDAGPEAVLRELATCHTAVGIRLHFQIFATLAGAKICGLGQEPKARAFADEVGLVTLERSASVSELTDAIKRAKGVGDASLCALRARAEKGVDDLWDEICALGLSSVG